MVSSIVYNNGMIEDTDGFPQSERERLLRVLRAHRPRFVWLFGSRAGRTARAESDVDLLIVDENVGGDTGIEIDISMALMPRQYHLDILAYTPEVLEQKVGEQGSFVREILDTAELLYERT
jgi:predicted nucleotidyltransferase